MELDTFAFQIRKGIIDKFAVKLREDDRIGFNRNDPHFIPLDPVFFAKRRNPVHQFAKKLDAGKTRTADYNGETVVIFIEFPSIGIELALNMFPYFLGSAYICNRKSMLFQAFDSECFRVGSKCNDEIIIW